MKDMDLLNHLTADSQQPNPPIQQCPHCPYQCERSDKLKIHVLSVHSDSRPFPCNFCEKRFKLKDKLNMHVNTVHLKRKPFECGFCNQVFGRKDAAKRHEKQWCSNRPVKTEWNMIWKLKTHRRFYEIFSKSLWIIFKRNDRNYRYWISSWISINVSRVMEFLLWDFWPRINLLLQENCSILWRDIMLKTDAR